MGEIRDHHAIPLQAVGQAVLGGVLAPALVHAEEPVPVPDELISDAARPFLQAHPQVQAGGSQGMREICRDLPGIAIQLREGPAVGAVLHVRTEELAGHLQGHLRDALRKRFGEALEPAHPVGPRRLLSRQREGRESQEGDAENPPGTPTRGRHRDRESPVGAEIDEGHGRCLLEG